MQGSIFLKENKQKLTKISQNDLNKLKSLINNLSENKENIITDIQNQSNNNLLNDNSTIKINSPIETKETNEIIIGYALANRFNLKIEDKVKIAIPKSDKTIFGNIFLHKHTPSTI